MAPTWAGPVEAMAALAVDYFPDLSATDGSCPEIQIENQVEASGTAENTVVRDLSDDGDDPSPGATNDVGGADDATMVTMPALDCSGLDVSKTTTTPVVPGPNGGEALAVDYDITVENVADVDLTVSPTDDLAAVFGAGATVTSVAVAATGPCAGSENPSFGIGDSKLLATPVVLQADPGDHCRRTPPPEPEPEPELPDTGSSVQTLLITGTGLLLTGLAIAWRLRRRGRIAQRIGANGILM